MRAKVPRRMVKAEREAMDSILAAGAAAANISEERMAVAFAALLERTVDLVAIGKVVPFYNVLKVGAVPEGRKFRWARNNMGHPYCVPKVVFGRYVRAQVKSTAPNSNTAKIALDNFSRNTTRARDGSATRAFEELQDLQKPFFDSIADQMGD